MRRFYIVIITIAACAFAFASLEAVSAKDPGGPNVTIIKPTTQPVPVPYPNGPPAGPLGPPHHGPRSEPKYPLPLPTIRHSGTATKGTTKSIGETERNNHRK